MPSRESQVREADVTPSLAQSRAADTDSVRSASRCSTPPPKSAWPVGFSERLSRAVSADSLRDSRNLQRRAVISGLEPF